MTPLLTVLALLHLLSLAATEIFPDQDAARRNAFHIFNAVHSAMRQWGSSLNHNGLSFFFATVPPGTLLSHGSRHPYPPSTLEWLAFEIEHSQNFAWSLLLRKRHSSILHQARDGAAGERGNGHDDGDLILIPGYFHTYQTNRELKLLYVDGMSAADNVAFGPMDSQDFVLRRQPPPDPGSGLGKERAAELCRVADEWGLDGIIRMEIGFEIIYCNFTTGLDMISALGQPTVDVEHHVAPYLFEWVRAVSQRYDGIGGNRVRVDFSSMVSAWFYAINTTNPDKERPELPRLVGATVEERQGIRSHVAEMATNRSRETVRRRFDWQTDVVDMIVARYSETLAALTSPDCPDEKIVTQVTIVTALHFDEHPSLDSIGNRERIEKAITRCTEYYFLPASRSRTVWTSTDDLLYTAISEVVSHICTTFYHSRDLLHAADPRLFAQPIHFQKATSISVSSDLGRAIAASRKLFTSLAEKLQWTTWKRCRSCSVNEVCFIAMFPFGGKVDHYEPGCRNWTEMGMPERWGLSPEGYWQHRRRASDSLWLQ